MKTMLPKEAFRKNAHIYKILSHHKRLEILNLLKDGELSVEEILKTVKILKSNLSQHLTILRYNGLVKTRKDGLNVHYKIVDKRIIEPCKILHKLRIKHIVS